MPARSIVRPFAAACITLAFLSAHALAADLYVDAGGKPGGDGSIEKPFQTIMRP